ncbi:MAG: calcium/sodium antiporter [Clostridiales bacterium]|nr:calcium/sodium antiporter [Clostridiales bacterium]
MNIFLALLALIGGFVLLIKGADWFVEGSSSVAKLLKVPAIIIGLTVVAFGTSLPEASVSISSAIAGKNALAVSNVVGSNIFNTLVVLGASALIAPVCVLPTSIKKEIPFSILCTVALLVALLLGMNPVVPAVSEGSAAVAGVTYTLGAAGGAVLLAIFAFYMYWQISSALKVRKAGAVEEDDEIKVLSPLKSLIFIVVGIACIILGGDFVVDGASAIAIKFGMSETLVGMTIVALGTSLPELVTSMIAAKKGESDLALGNVVGSNIFNIVYILGMSAVVSPITVDILAVIDTIAVIGVSALVLLFAATDRKVNRVEGAIMLAAYIGYFIYMFVR